MVKGSKNIILVDDHQIIIDGLKSLLNQMKGIKVTGAYTNPKDALFHIEKRKVDLVLTDLSMPGMDGLQFTELVKERNKAIKVVALTMHDDVKTIKKMIDLGADGYILKNTDYSVLQVAIERVLNNQEYYEAKVVEAIINKFKPSVEVNGKRIALSKREVDILELIADGLTTDQIAKKLFISKHTVNSHRRNLNVKLGVSRPAELVSKAKELSLI
ncbi:MAG: response regulator transcription factor [Bacteroidia bacterium]|nr:response regulator transcription factor [Bacteroidia bacterium]